MRLWPEGGWKSSVRFGLLIVVLVISVTYGYVVYEVREFVPAAAQGVNAIVLARSFEGILQLPFSDDPKTIELHATYFPGALSQTSMLAACRRSWRESGFVPTSREALTQSGVALVDQTDPWGRPYRVRLLPTNLLIIQSTGPSGQDLIPPAYFSGSGPPFPVGSHLIGDNLVLGFQLEDRTTRSDVRPKQLGAKPL